MEPLAMDPAAMDTLVGSMHSLAINKTRPTEVFPYAAKMNELAAQKCGHPPLAGLRGHASQPVPASCPDCHERVVVMAQLFGMTCPSEWSTPSGSHLARCLMDTIERNSHTDEIMDIGCTIAYRWKLGQLADKIVQVFKLPVPSGQTCMIWVSKGWRPTSTPDYILAYAWYFFANRRMPNPSPAQGPDFVRFRRYLTASVVEGNLSVNEVSELVDRILSYIQNAKDDDSDLAYGNGWNIERQLELREQCF